MDIYKGGKHILGWHAGVQAKEQTTFAWSSKGWTDNELGLEWVEKNFEKFTAQVQVPPKCSLAPADRISTKKQPRTPILDGHGSHLIW
jgi:hypothetical protein